MHNKDMVCREVDVWQRAWTTVGHAVGKRKINESRREGALELVLVQLGVLPACPMPHAGADAVFSARPNTRAGSRGGAARRAVVCDIHFCVDHAMPHVPSSLVYVQRAPRLRDTRHTL